MTSVQEKSLPLTLEPEPVQFPAAHYVFIEKRGSIPANAPQAWNELHRKSCSRWTNGTYCVGASDSQSATLGWVTRGLRGMVQVRCSTW